MAVLKDIYEADYDCRYEEVSEFAHPLYEFVEKFDDKLPMDCLVFGDKYAIESIPGISEGDTVHFLRTTVRIRISTLDENENADQSYYEVPIKKHTVFLPDDYPGTFQVASRYPDGHEFDSVAELAADLPEYILVREELEIQDLGVTINPGDRLKLISKQSNGIQKWIECKHIKTGTLLSLPLDMNLKVRKKLDRNMYSVHELSGRLPARVSRVSDISTHIRGLDLSITGIPDDYDGVLFLDKVKYIEAELCNSEKRIEIPATANISVLPQSVDVKHYGPNQSIHALAKKAFPGRPVYASLSSTESDDHVISKGVIVAVHAPVEREGILVKGHTNGMIVPKDFHGGFKVEGTQYPTAMDLLESGFRGKVRATKTCILEEELKKYKMDNIYEFDMVKLHSKDRESLQGILLQHAEVDIVELTREMSTKGLPGLISFPSDLKANFVAPPPTIQNHTLSKIIEKDWVDHKVTYTSSQKSGLTLEDYMLVKESPLRILGVYQYSATCVTELNSDTGEAVDIEEIPEWVEIKARQLLTGLPPDKSSTSTTPSRSSIIQLTVDTYEEIVEKVQPSATYEAVDVHRIGPRAPKKPTPPPKPTGTKPKALLPIGHRERFPTPPGSPKGDSGRQQKERGRSHSETEVFQPHTAKKSSSKRQSLPQALPLADTKQSKTRGAFNTLRLKRAMSSASTPFKRSLPGSGDKSQASKAKNIQAVEPPSDGDISHFTVEQIAGLMRHLAFSDKTVENALAKKIDGAKLSKMKALENKHLKDNLKLDVDMQLFTVRHFIDKSAK